MTHKSLWPSPGSAKRAMLIFQEMVLTNSDLSECIHTLIRWRQRDADLDRRSNLDQRLNLPAEVAWPQQVHDEGRLSGLSELHAMLFEETRFNEELEIIDTELENKETDDE